MSEAGRVRGSCLCGAVRFEIERSGVVSAHHCHCDDCRRATGSGFATFCMLPESAFEQLGAEPKLYEVTGESGGKVNRAFCGTCGSQLYSKVGVMPGFLFVKAGVLDDASWVEPVSSFWGSSAQPWAPADTRHPVHEGNPG
jgi:hypothetical protein